MSISHKIIDGKKQAQVVLDDVRMRVARLKELGWTEEQFAAFVSGFRAAYSGIPYPTTEATRRLLDASQQKLAVANPEAPSTSPAKSTQHFDRLEAYFAQKGKSE